MAQERAARSSEDTAARDGHTPAGLRPPDATEVAVALGAGRTDHPPALLRRLPTVAARRVLVQRLGRGCGNRLLQRVLAPPAAAHARRDEDAADASGGRPVQRFAFINEAQVDKGAKGLSPAMLSMVSDAVVRNYTSLDEFTKHAGKQTDYLGNLADGTWLRFSPTGLNLLGENHTHVTLDQVVPAVGSTNFIDEQLSSDDLTAAPSLKAAYETENQAMFKKFGVDAAKDKQPFGAESLFPKMGFALTLALPYFEGASPMSDLDKTGYTGKPVQRYLKIAWGHSKDNKLAVEQKRTAKEKIPPKMEALAKVHAAVAGKLDAFITGLAVDGFLGDELGKSANAGLLAPLAEFARALTEAMVELATTDPSSRLSAAERKKLAAAKSTSAADKIKLFSEWRNFRFEDNVKAAAKRGVRYAGMGQAHLDHLVNVGLDKGMHPFEMDGKDITAFKALTDKLTKAAKTP